MPHGQVMWGLKYIGTWKVEWILVGGVSGRIMVTPCFSPVVAICEMGTLRALQLL